MLDSVAIMAILGVIGSITVFVVLGYRVTRLIKITNSDDLK
jgi:hypothetical protein